MQSNGSCDKVFKNGVALAHFRYNYNWRGFPLFLHTDNNIVKIIPVHADVQK